MAEQLNLEDVRFLIGETDRLAATAAIALTRGLPVFDAVNAALAADWKELGVEELRALYCVAMVMLAQERVDSDGS